MGPTEMCNFLSFPTTNADPKYNGEILLIVFIHVQAEKIIYTIHADLKLVMSHPPVGQCSV